MGEEEIYGTETLWRGFGNYISRNEQHHRSLKYYDLAIKTTPNDKKTLIDRARARARCNKYQEALEDIKNALKIDRNDLLALAEKAHTTFLNTEFEQALIQNHRLLPLRSKPDNFFLGIMKCTSTIEQCLGDIAGKPLRDHFLIIRRLAWKWNMDAEREVSYLPKNKKEIKKKRRPKRERRRSSLEPQDESLQIRDSLHSHMSESFLIPPLETTVKFSPLQRYTKNIENYMAEKYLDRMYREKVFLKKMIKYSGTISPNAAGSKILLDLAKDTYLKVSQKQDVLRTSRPFYFIKYQEARISGKLKNRQAAELVLHQQNYKKEAEKILFKMENAYNEKNLLGIIEMSEKLIAYCNAKPKRLLPDKDEYLHRIHNYLRKGFYELYRINPDQVSWDQDKRILVCLDQPISREPSTDSVINQFSLGITDIHQQILIFEERIEKAETPDEICWCYHELARYNMLAKKYDAARIYCKRCMNDIENDKTLEEWYLNLTMLLVRTSIRQQNKIDALNEAQAAFSIAEKRKDENLKEYLKRMMHIISEIEFDDASGVKVTARRQKKILALMTNDKMKEEIQHLFRTMAALPHGRRLSIVPNAYKSKGEQAVGSSAIKLVGGKSKSKSRLTSLDETASKPPEGAEFMQLIQFHV